MRGPEERLAIRRRGRSFGLRIFEIALVLPMLVYFGHSIYTNPGQFGDREILIWIIAIAAVDLLPVPTTVSAVAFSLSFPARALGGAVVSDTGRCPDRVPGFGRSR